MVLTAFGIAFVVNAGSRSTGRRAGQGQGAAAHSARLTVPQAEAPAGAAPTPATTEAAGAAAAAQAPATPPPPPRTFEVVVSVDPARATVELDGVEVAHGSYRTTLPVDRMRHIMKVHADGFGSVEFEFTDGPPPSRIRLAPVRAILRRDRPAAAAKPVRRGSAPEAGRKRMTMPPARADDDTGDYGRDDGAMSDIPDPWAADIDAHPEGPE